MSTATTTVPAAALRKAARWAAPDPRVPVPVLANVRVSVTGGQLAVAWFDWETCRLGRAAGPGDQGTASVLVSHGQLTAAIRALPGEQVEVTVHDGDRVDLVTVPGTAEAQRISVGQDADPAAYPALPAPPPPAGWCDGGVLGPALAQIAGCCSIDDTLPVIAAVHLVPGQDLLGLEGTNRYVLGLHDVPFHRAGPAPHTGEGFLIPAVTVAAFARDCGGPVLVGPPGPGGFALLGDAWHALVVKVTTGDYPRVRSIVNRTPPVLAAFGVDAGELAKVAAHAGTVLDEAVEQMIRAALADEDDPRPAKDKRRALHAGHDGHGMFLTAGPAGAEVFAVHPAGGELGRWTVVAAPCDAEAAVSLNPQHLCRVLPGGPVTVHLSGPRKPVRITTGGAYEGVICPIDATRPAPADNGR
jgi:DNA polymerase-3 subunit beta